MALHLKNNYSCRIEDELLQGIHEQAGERNGKDGRPGAFVSPSETKVNY
jgi:hypothetical protein